MQKFARLVAQAIQQHQEDIMVLREKLGWVNRAVENVDKALKGYDVPQLVKHIATIIANQELMDKKLNELEDRLL